MLAAPSPMLNIPPPAKHIPTCMIVELSGVIIDTIINRSIPAASEPQSASHALCFAATLTSTKIGTNTNIKRIFASIQATMLKTFKPPRSKDRLEIPPPSIAPTK